MKKLTTEDYIKKAQEKHGNLYNYDNVIYINSRNKIKITCNTCKTVFTPTANNHLNGTGCPKCSKQKTITTLTKTKEQFIKEATKLHNKKYTYDDSNYINDSTKLTIKCNVCETLFEQRPNHHLKGVGCPICARKQRAEKTKYTKEQYINKAVQVHKNKYDYSNINYTTSKDKINIYCNNCNSYFTQVAAVHLKGQGCPSCANYGYDSNSPGILYYLSINNGEAYKIGITNKSVNERFSPQELQTIQIIGTKYYQDGKECYNKEQYILNKYKEYIYTKSKLLHSGNTELFTCNILKDEIEWDIYSPNNNKQL